MTKHSTITRLALLALTASAALLASPLRAEDTTRTFSISGRAHLRVVVDDASVKVSTGDVKQIEVRLQYFGYKLNNDLRFDANQNGDSVEVQVKTSGGWHWSSHHTSLQLEIHMPRNADFEATAGDGSVEVDSLNGEVNIRTGDGHIEVQRLHGNMRLQAGDGHIQGRDLDGRADITTGDGHVDIDGRFDSLNIRTGDGSVTARVGRGSQVQSAWNIHTGDGSVDLELPGELQANLDASTHDGHISLGIPVMVEGTFSSTKISGKMNGGGNPIVVRTGDGSIHLNKV